MVGPGARKPSVGEGIRVQKAIVLLWNHHSPFSLYFFLSFIFTFASILVCVNNSDNTVVLRVLSWRFVQQAPGTEPSLVKSLSANR